MRNEDRGGWRGRGRSRHLAIGEIGGSEIGGSEIGGSEIGGSEIGGSEIGSSKIGGSEVNYERLFRQQAG